MPLMLVAKLALAAAPVLAAPASAPLSTFNLTRRSPPLAIHHRHRLIAPQQVMGSTRLARSAGTRLATTAIASRNNATKPNTTGSLGPTPTKRCANSPVTKQRGRHAKSDAQQGQPDPVSEHLANESFCRGSQRYPDPEFPRPLPTAKDMTP
jgi:hypothetical protein